MHEIAFAKRVVEEAEKEGASKFVHVVVGELAEITPEEIKEAVENLVDWKVQVDFEKSEVECDSCGHKGEARIVDKGHGYCVFNCSSCGKKPRVLKGGEIKVVGVE